VVREQRRIDADHRRIRLELAAGGGAVLHLQAVPLRIAASD